MSKSDKQSPSEQVLNAAFIAGAQQMREMLSRFVESTPGDPNPDPKVIAQSMRLNWVPSWGDDPGSLPAGFDFSTQRVLAETK